LFILLEILKTNGILKENDYLCVIFNIRKYDEVDIPSVNKFMMEFYRINYVRNRGC